MFCGVCTQDRVAATLCEAGRQARLDPHGCLKVQTDLGTDLMSG